ncbi:VOC family protein [Microlunatus soli]|uniref:Uncharacterized conserved protein PhnB, glyoxalase superfamily n=1 Tax=Microlunatus soli TaxID=630515 RepID=A0A1H1T916_9ACTN|nr:VOC family protein [Microlunatus soli]SDS56631.1 Uncharacterized conserved protein PhnB, glyoxalase superfamily [Microlunatus soli]
MSDSATTTAQTTRSGEPAPTVWPAFQVRDADSMVTFLTDVLGFENTALYADGGTIAHAQFDWPEGGGVMFGSVAENSVWQREPGVSGFYVVTDRVDEIFQRVQASGAKVLREPTDTDYGNHEFSCADPEGNLWSFGTYRGEPPTGS